MQTELSRNQPRAKAVMKRVPHVLPYREVVCCHTSVISIGLLLLILFICQRVKMLRELVSKDRQALGLVQTRDVAPRPTYIQIYRSRFLEVEPESSEDDSSLSFFLLIGCIQATVSAVVSQSERCDSSEIHQRTGAVLHSSVILLSSLACLFCGKGLAEAGIDQDGVFKEFLEDTIKRVFDPSLTLFKVCI